MSVPIPIHENTYKSWKERSEYFEQIRARIAAMPRVIGAGISTNATPPANGWENKIEIMGSSDAEKPVVRVNFISPEYFPVLRIPLAQGRMWDQAETMRGAQLAVINQTMARQYWPKGDAIGRQLRIPGLKNEPPYSPAALGSEGWLRIVGIVADARDDGLRNPVKPAVFLPYTLKLRMFTQILVRTRVAPLSMLRDVRAELVQIDKEQQVMRVRDLEGWITGMPEYAQQRLVATLFAIFSALALVLAAAGLYALTHNIERLAEDHARAQTLATALAEVRPGLVDPKAVETNIVPLDLTVTTLDSATLAAHCRASGVLVSAVGPRRVRLVTHLDVDDEGITRALDVLRPVLAA